MSALAISLHRQGYKVTGSDKGFFPPVSDHLKNAGVEYYPGWHVDKMTKNGDPDLVVVGNVAGSENPEWVYVQEKNIPYKSYPELIAEFFVKKNSIVCAGTYGKTSSASLLTWILKENNFDPTYMFGGLSLNDMMAAELTDSDYSILEGDEYKSARWDMRPKFAHYSPTHLLLTSCKWDHADVYPTEESYFEAFEALVGELPTNATIVVSEEVKNIKRLKDRKIVSYGKSAGNNYQFTNVISSKNGVLFEINKKSTIYNLQSTIIGQYTPKIITGCFAMAEALGIESDGIIKAVETYKGTKRRLEKRLDGDITVFDDIAHSPAKARGVLDTLKKLYSGKVIAVFEPNTGNRTLESIPGYDNAFGSADEIIIPRLTQVKTAVDDPNPPFDGVKLAEVISKTHSNVKYIEEDKKLIEYLVSETKKDDCVVFLGSHGFRGMIDALKSKLK
ncbi:hypothetical protein KJ641_02020 [Patescibacteria group bacterium]|nr:hypothetical protein [Patescibacteria group bacterium]MBU1895625.1 hypothetical protein [Patescibacteria group bacterium]